ncbi:MAG: hypothetical protein JEY71_14685 [Sphaerochaeta sp.]|nr:hypothetical protein [Sphaerochaeta sp.]
MHKRPRTSLIVIGFLCSILFAGCSAAPSNTVLPKPIGELVIPNDFTFKTTAPRSVTHAFGANFSHIPIAIYGSVYDTFTEDQPVSDSFVGFGTTDETGELSTQVTIPLSCTYLVLKPNYIGLPEELRTALDDSSFISKAVTARGEDPVYTFSITEDLPKTLPAQRFKPTDSYWNFVNGYSLDGGIPDSLFSISLEKDFLKDLNSLFKRNRGIDDSVPQDITDGLAVGTLDMSAANDVWITFIDEQ